MRKKTQYIVVNEIYKTIYCGYPQKRAWKNLTTAEGGAATWRSIPGIDDEDVYHQFQLYSLHAIDGLWISPVKRLVIFK